MSPEELIHFADRIAMIGVYEGLWWAIERGKGDPDGLRVRLDDGTLAIVVGRCDGWPEPMPWSFNDCPYIYAAHTHRSDTLRWKHGDIVHSEACALARA